jgi:GntR family transcriptional repressor for pyruvate dehydrogenase complex
MQRLARDPSLSDKVADWIGDEIVSGRLAPGDRLDSERELAERLGVSRSVVREALRSVAAQGLVVSAGGRGFRVAAAGSEAVASSLRLYVRRSPARSYTRVHEVRIALEMQAAALAAERATEEDLAELEALMLGLEERFDALGEHSPSPDEAAELAQLDVAFNRQIAVATHNDLFVAMLDSIGEALIEARAEKFTASEVVAFARRANAEIVDSIRTRDPERARATLRNRLLESEALWQRLVQAQ